MSASNSYRDSHLWVVEIDFGDGKGWMPTVGCGLSRDHGREALRQWREENPADKFRLRKYLPQPHATNGGSR